MDENTELVAHLLNRLDDLIKRQESVQKDIADLRAEIAGLKESSLVAKTAPEPVSPSAKPAEEPEIITASQLNSDSQSDRNTASQYREEPVTEHHKPVDVTPGVIKKEKTKSNLEKFIGENLINKIGIAVTIIGVGIGAKYAIDHELISPLTRIILGYLVGLGLLGFAFRLKKQYENFSAVLLSGSMAIVYFITFAAYSFFGLITLVPAFALMVIFTIFTVGAAITYNKQVVALIGLVGAYAVPFLLDSGSGKVAILFSYMAVINIGILAISFQKYWKSLYYSSFVLTWLIFYLWYIPKYQPAEHFGLALTFVSVFFATFYLIFLAYKLLKKEKFESEDILLLLANSAIFFGLGYAILNSDHTGKEFLGCFSLGNALIHFAVAVAIWLQKTADRNLFWFVIGLAVVFFTIAIPVQLDGHWVTLLWAGEVAVLFWIGRTKNAATYEWLSYPLMFLVFLSILHDWTTVYSTYDPQIPATRIITFFNMNFLTSLVVIASFGFITYLHIQKKYLSPLDTRKFPVKIMNYAIPSLFMIVLFFSFIMEISTFWNQMYIDSMVAKNQDLTVPQHFQDENILRYSTISIINYSLLFLSILSFVNILKLKGSLLGIINLGFNTIALCVFLTLGLYTLGELRESYLSQTLSEFYYRGGFTIGIRYISFAFAGLIVFAIYKYVRWSLLPADLKMEFDLLLHITILTIASNELLNWMDLYEPGQSYKLGLSILFGIYALLLVALGIGKKKVHLRIAAIVLFAGTLIKLFFYDISYLNTISKTIVFVSLGVLLLIISFLYNKYRKLIFDDAEEKHDG